MLSIICVIGLLVLGMTSVSAARGNLVFSHGMKTVKQWLKLFQLIQKPA
ncbi:MULTISPECIES: hypothetical protein [unclassified Granulicatella]|nr:MULTISPECIES: hypothetical protein [unclassified Granulicatella]MBF0780725.1 hypothetical protein [Granulicatella sp. 19428wC4_WM01]